MDALLSGTHVRSTCHYELLRAFVPVATLEHMEKQLDLRAYRTHEFGDSILVEKAQVWGPNGASRACVPGIRVLAQQRPQDIA